MPSNTAQSLFKPFPRNQLAIKAQSFPRKSSNPRPPWQLTTPEISHETSVQFKFPTAWKTLITKFLPHRGDKGVKCSGYAWGGDTEASIWPIHKCTVFGLFYFVFEANFPSTSPAPGDLYLEGRFNGGFFALPVWGAYTWREFYGISASNKFYTESSRLSIQVNSFSRIGRKNLEWNACILL